MRDLSKRRAELLSLSQSESGRSQRLLMSLYWPWISKLSKSVGDRVLLMVVGGRLLLQGGTWLVRGISGPLRPLLTMSFSPLALDLLHSPEGQRLWLVSLVNGDQPLVGEGKPQ